MVADLEDPASGQRIVDEAVTAFGTVDVLVNNAALGPLTSILDTTPDLYDTVMSINLHAPFMLVKAAIPVMSKNGGGSIVNITTVGAIRGVAEVSKTVYAASKAALLGMMVDIATAYGRQGIRINCVVPGAIRTPMADHALREKAIDPTKITNMGANTPLGIEGDAWDIALRCPLPCQ